MMLSFADIKELVDMLWCSPMPDECVVDWYPLTERPSVSSIDGDDSDDRTTGSE